jgi:hypothetical protein
VRLIIGLLALLGAMLPGSGGGYAPPAGQPPNEPGSRIAPTPVIQARVRVVVPQLGPGWRTGMLNGTRQEPTCYLVLLFHPGRTRQVVATVYLGAVARLEVSSLYPGTGPADPDPAGGSYDGEEWREVRLDWMKASGKNCPTGIEPSR